MQAVLTFAINENFSPDDAASAHGWPSPAGNAKNAILSLIHTYRIASGGQGRLAGNLKILQNVCYQRARHVAGDAIKGSLVFLKERWSGLADLIFLAENVIGIGEN